MYIFLAATRWRKIYTNGQLGRGSTNNLCKEPTVATGMLNTG